MFAQIRRLSAFAACMMVGAGCSLGPRNFRSIDSAAPITRARAASLSNQARADVAIPALIARLDDADPVVRLAAYGELKRRTGQDFGYLAWADAADRRPAVEKYQAWWQQASNQADPSIRRTSRRVVRARG